MFKSSSRLVWRCRAVGLLAFGVLAASALAADVALVRQGEPAAVIVLPAEPDKQETYAAEQLQKHLRAMSGAELAIVTVGEAMPEGMTPILIGSAAPASIDAEIKKVGTDPGSIGVVVEPNRVCLKGLSAEASAFAVAELLEQLGVRWFFPGELGTVIPESKDVNVAVRKTCQTPGFPSRYFWHGTPLMRCGGRRFPGAHGFPGVGRVSPEELFKEHPDWFAEIDGERRRAQLCVSNMELIRFIASHLVEGQKKREPGTPTSWIGLGPFDGAGFCECDECDKLDAGDWDPFSGDVSVTDRYIWAFNQILAEMDRQLGKKADVRLCFYAYHSYMRPPLKTEPDPRIIPALAVIGLCRIHGPANPVCPEKSYYRWLVQEWGKRVPLLYERGYWFNLADPGLPFPMMHRMRNQIPLGHKLGLDGWNVEVLAHHIALAPSLYIASKLLWDPSEDVDALIDDYCERGFGPAAPAVRAYLDLFDTRLRDCDYHAGSCFESPLIFPAELRQRAGDMLTGAAAMADAPMQKKRIRAMQLNIEYLNAFCDMMESRAVHRWVDAKEALDRFEALREEQIDLDPQTINKRFAVAYLNRFFKPCVEQGHARATEEGNKIVATLDDEWRFLIDPKQVGMDLGYYRADVTGGDWQPMRTSTTTWGNEGLRYYKGLAWYRQEFDVSEEFKGQRVFLWCGGVDEQARVWVNGKEIGVSHGGTFVPFEMDATTAILPGEKNSIAVLIKNERVDELGTGGIVAPALFYQPAAGAKAQLMENSREPGRTFP